MLLKRWSQSTIFSAIKHSLWKSRLSRPLLYWVLTFSHYWSRCASTIEAFLESFSSRKDNASRFNLPQIVRRPKYFSGLSTALMFHTALTSFFCSSLVFALNYKLDFDSLITWLDALQYCSSILFKNILFCVVAWINNVESSANGRWWSVRQLLCSFIPSTLLSCTARATKCGRTS